MQPMTARDFLRVALQRLDVAVEIMLCAGRFAQSVAIDAGDFVPEDNYFHMAPGSERIILARAATPGAPFTAIAHPLNAYEETRLALVTRGAARAAEHT